MKAIVFFIAFQFSIAASQTMEQIDAQIDSLQVQIKVRSDKLDELKSLKERLIAQRLTQQEGMWIRTTGVALLKETMLLDGKIMVPPMTLLLAVGQSDNRNFVKVKFNDKIYFIYKEYIKLTDSLSNFLKLYRQNNKSIQWVKPICSILRLRPHVIDTVTILRQGCNVLILEKDEGWCRIQTNDNTYEGWIKENDLSDSEVKLISNEDFRKELYLLNHRNIAQKFVTAIREGTIMLGMTREMVIVTWGEPEDVHKTVGSWGVHEQWIYKHNQYVYFENDILTSWQD